METDATTPMQIYLNFMHPWWILYYFEIRLPNVATQSPNRQSLNEVSGQLNTARPMQRIPDVYGVDAILYPDLLSPQLSEYSDPRTQKQQSILTPGDGVFDVKEVRIGNSPIVYDPFDDPNFNNWDYRAADDAGIVNFLEFDESEEVNGQVLKGVGNQGFGPMKLRRISPFVTVE